MAELNLKQIVDKLNAEFSGEGRKLVFWYDDAAEFNDEIDRIELTNAKIYRLEPGAQFKTKYFLERQDAATNYLIYAPFPKPELRNNHLADTIRYSSEFSATRAALICRDLHIDDQFKPQIQHYIDVKFFTKENTQRFCELELNHFSADIINTAIMSVLCRSKSVSIEAVLLGIIADGEAQAEQKIAEFEKYDLLKPFWNICEAHFGYREPQPSLKKLLITMFVTEAKHSLRTDLPDSWAPFISDKAGNIIAFLESLKNNILHSARYDELSGTIARELRVSEAFKKVSPEALLRCDTFTAADSLLIHWINDRLLAEDTGALLDTLTIPQICQARRKTHFKAKYENIYEMMEHACCVIQAAHFNCPYDFNSLIKRYAEQDCLIDTHYRKFYQTWSNIADNSAFEKLRELIENIYSNEYLGKIVPTWNKFMCDNAECGIPSQRTFFDSYVRPCKDRVLVIISDAMRYELARELMTELHDHEKCTVKLDMLMGMLPSYTALGMAALLPHRTLSMTDELKVLADGQPTFDTSRRQAILQAAAPNSLCIRFDEIKAMKRQELRQLFTGQEIIYIYHNQIDARGEAFASENEVFTACREAVQEIHELVLKLTDAVSTTHYIVTSDHGFIYRHDKVREYDKLAAQTGAKCVERRFMITAAPQSGDGIVSLPLSHFLGNDDSRSVVFPVGVDLFKAGGGQNYVHGGSSPQEMLIPVLDIRTAKGHQETQSVSISMVSMIPKVTNLITTLDFLQTESVSDVMKAAKYKIRFEDESKTPVSNEITHIAESREKEPQKRLFRLRFTLKNQKYERSRHYYLVAYGEHDIEIIRHEVIVDIAFADDFGFNL